MTIYERIKFLRISKGMSQQELALKVGYEGRSAISKVENGERDISQSMIIKYADALGVTPTYLLYGDEAQEKLSTQLDDTDLKILELLTSLSAEKQKQALDYLRFLVEHSDNQ